MTATLPYLMLLVFFIRGLTLDGAMDGITYYVTPVWKKLLEPAVSRVVNDWLSGREIGWMLFRKVILAQIGKSKAVPCLILKFICFSEVTQIKKGLKNDFYICVC